MKVRRGYIQTIAYCKKYSSGAEIKPFTHHFRDNLAMCLTLFLLPKKVFRNSAMNYFVILRYCQNITDVLYSANQ